MNHLLVTGASGFVGWHICNQMRHDYRMTGTFCNRNVSLPGVAIWPFDLLQSEAAPKLLDEAQPDAVIHTAAIADAHICEKQPEETKQLNVNLPETLAQACKQRHIDLLFTSTDLVFDGNNPPYDENSTPYPVSVYGKQKAEAEEKILNAHPRSTVCRFPLLFGRAAPHGKSFLQSTLEAMRQGRKLTLFTDESRTPVSIYSAIDGMKLALSQKVPIIHLGGRNRIDRLSLGKMIAETFGIANPPIKACRQEDISLPAPRPADVSLSSAYAYSLGFNPPPLQDELQGVADSGA